MSRRHSAEKREVIPDAKFGDVILTKFMNSIMYDGKKSIAEAIVYDAFDIIEQKMRSEPLPVFKQALDNVAPAIEVRSRRVGGATYQVPVEVRAERRQALAIRWIINAAREITKESAIYRRERLANLRIGPYVLSKVVVLTLLVLIQSLILLLLIGLKVRLPAMGVLLCRNCPIFSICGTTNFTPACGSIKEGSAFLSLSVAAFSGSITR